MDEKKKERPIDVEPLLWENAMRNDYRDSVNEYVNRRKADLLKERDKVLYLPEEEKRELLLRMLGEPVVGDFDKSIRLVKTEDVYTDEILEAKRYTFEILGCIQFAGFFYRTVKKSSKKKALIFALHGGGGTPERVGDVFHDSDNYNHLVRRVLNENTIVFAPQLMLWNPDVYGSEYDRIWLNRRMIQQGGSFTALEIFCLMRVLDWFETNPEVDTARTGVIGLSYGGMYTLYFSAIDTRIKTAVSDCWFNDRAKHAWHDWTYFNAEKYMFDTEVASLVLPRKLYIEMGKEDPTFVYQDAKEEINRLLSYAKEVKQLPSLRLVAFNGGHELNKNNDTILEFLKDLKV